MRIPTDTGRERQLPAAYPRTFWQVCPASAGTAAVETLRMESGKLPWPVPVTIRSGTWIGTAVPLRSSRRGGSVIRTRRFRIVARKGRGIIYLTRQWQIRTRIGRNGPATPCRWPGKHAVATILQADKDVVVNGETSRQVRECLNNPVFPDIRMAWPVGETPEPIGDVLSRQEMEISMPEPTVPAALRRLRTD